MRHPSGAAEYADDDGDDRKKKEDTEYQQTLSTVKKIVDNLKGIRTKIKSKEKALQNKVQAKEDELRNIAQITLGNVVVTLAIMEGYSVIISAIVWLVVPVNSAEKGSDSETEFFGTNIKPTSTGAILLNGFIVLIFEVLVADVLVARYSKKVSSSSRISRIAVGRREFSSDGENISISREESESSPLPFAKKISSILPFVNPNRTRSIQKKISSRITFMQNMIEGGGPTGPPTRELSTKSKLSSNSFQQQASSSSRTSRISRNDPKISALTKQFSIAPKISSSSRGLRDIGETGETGETTDTLTERQIDATEGADVSNTLMDVTVNIVHVWKKRSKWAYWIFALLTCFQSLWWIDRILNKLCRYNLGEDMILARCAS